MPLTIHEIGGWLAVVAVIGSCLIVLFRSRSRIAISEEWKELAMIKANRISELEARIQRSEEEIRQLRIENEELRKLNLELQLKVQHLEQGMEAA